MQIDLLAPFLRPVSPPVTHALEPTSHFLSLTHNSVPVWLPTLRKTFRPPMPVYVAMGEVGEAGQGGA